MGRNTQRNGPGRWWAAGMAGGGFGMLALIGLLAVLIGSPDLLRGPAAKPTLTPVPATPLPGGTIKIGLIDFMPGAANRPAIYNSIHLAVAQANAAGGITIAGKSYQIAIRPTNTISSGTGIGDPAKADTVSRALNEPTMLAAVGLADSYNGMQMRERLTQAAVPYVNPLDTDPFPHGRLTPTPSAAEPFEFSLYTRDDLVGWGAADYLYDQRHARKLAILDEGEAFGNTVAAALGQRFKDRSGQVLLDEMLLPPGNLGTTMPEIEYLKPDAVFYNAIEIQSVAQARMGLGGANPPRAPLFMANSAVLDDRFLQTGGM
jgi:ABC-type branched-subunit amino acid transport system substrate-binding protein